MKIIPKYWVIRPDMNEMGEGILRVEMDNGVPLDVCVYDSVDFAGIEMDVETTFDFILMTRLIDIYEDEKDYEKNSDGLREVESLIPSGLLNIREDPAFKEEPVVLISGVVDYMFDPLEYGVAEDTSLIHLKCLGHIWDVMVERSTVPCGEIQVGNVLSGEFLVVGGPSAENNTLN